MSALHRLDPNLHVFAIDLRGHGASSMPNPATCVGAEECFRMTDFAQDVLSFTRVKNAHSATLAGHSAWDRWSCQGTGAHTPATRHTSDSRRTDAQARRAYSLHRFRARSHRGAVVQKAHRAWEAFSRYFYQVSPLEADPASMEFIAKNLTRDPTLSVGLPPPPETARVRIGTWIGGMRVLGNIDSSTRIPNLTVPTLLLRAARTI